MTLHCIALCVSTIVSFSPLHPDETASIGEPVQLTDETVFLKAGESYFDPGTKRVIFQAIEHPEEGQAPDDDYGMYLGSLTFDENGAITGLVDIERLSPEGSANTCGWFHPSEQSVVMFATTMTPLVDGDIPGYQRGSGKYRWAS